MISVNLYRLFVSKLRAALISSLLVTLGAMYPSSAAGQYQGTSPSFQSFDSAQGGHEVLIPSFSVNKASLRSVFKGLSKYSGVDIVMDPAVEGEITMEVTNKSWKQIFSIVCKMNNLVASREDQYIYVQTSEKHQQKQIDKANNWLEAEKVRPLKRQIVVLDHVPAVEMKKAIETMLSERGSITIAEHNNAMILFDTEDNIREIGSTIAQLDIETEQISIACKIIEVSSGDAMDMGVEWGFFGNNLIKSLDTLSFFNLGGGQSSLLDNPLGSLQYGILSPEIFKVTLQYIFEDNNAEVVAQPSITTLDNKEARIFMGQQVPLTKSDEAGNTTVEMVDAGTELIVTPRITSEGRVMLELEPKKKSYTLIGQTNDYIINEQSAQTQVVVNDGETVVIAGLTSTETQKTESGVPLLKEIPIIGNLFKKSQNMNLNKDLLIFVTPHILKEPSQKPVVSTP